VETLFIKDMDSQKETTSPSILNLVVAQTVGGIIAPLSCFYSSILVETCYAYISAKSAGIIREGIDPLTMDLIWIFIILLVGLSITFAQLICIRKFVPHRIFWILGGGAAFLLIILGLSFLTRPFTVPIVHLYYHEGLNKEATNYIDTLSLISGFVLGGLGGLVFSILQSILLTGKKRYWWIISSITWGIFGMLLLWLVNNFRLYNFGD
jgi:hypothetical protein